MLNKDHAVLPCRQQTAQAPAKNAMDLRSSMPAARGWRACRSQRQRERSGVRANLRGPRHFVRAPLLAPACLVRLSKRCTARRARNTERGRKRLARARTPIAPCVIRHARAGLRMKTCFCGDGRGGMWSATRGRRGASDLGAI
eukprot:1173025-Pleurochrysis_carterae.AAC.5